MNMNSEVYEKWQKVIDKDIIDEIVQRLEIDDGDIYDSIIKIGNEVLKKHKIVNRDAIILNLISIRWNCLEGKLLVPRNIGALPTWDEVKNNYTPAEQESIQRSMDRADAEFREMEIDRTPVIVESVLAGKFLDILKTISENYSRLDEKGQEEIIVQLQDISEKSNDLLSPHTKQKEEEYFAKMYQLIEAHEDLLSACASSRGGTAFATTRGSRGKEDIPVKNIGEICRLIIRQLKKKNKK